MTAFYFAGAYARRAEIADYALTFSELGLGQRWHFESSCSMTERKATA